MGVKELREKRVGRKDIKTRTFTKNIKVAYMRNDCASFNGKRNTKSALI